MAGAEDVMEKILFTKPNCSNCHWVKNNCDLSSVTILDCERADGLALLAYYGLVEQARKGLPILVYAEGADCEPFLSVDDIAIALGASPGGKMACDGDTCRLRED